MTVYKEQISLNSHGTTPTYLDITPQVKEAIKNSGIKSGTCTVISPHTTCCLLYTSQGLEILNFFAISCWDSLFL